MRPAVARAPAHRAAASDLQPPLPVESLSEASGGLCAPPERTGGGLVCGAEVARLPLAIPQVDRFTT